MPKVRANKPLYDPESNKTIPAGEVVNLSKEVIDILGSDVSPVGDKPAAKKTASKKSEPETTDTNE